jgi:hypothetical protein
MTSLTASGSVSAPPALAPIRKPVIQHKSTPAVATAAHAPPIR